MTYRLWYLMLLGTLACGDATAPSSRLGVTDAVPAIDTATLHTAWRNMEQCSGLTHPALHFEELAFYSVPRDPFTYADSTPLSGLFIADWRQVYVALYNVQPHPSIHTMRVLYHELMHVLLWPRPSNDHPAEWFLNTPCGNLMDDLAFQTGPHV